jgi:CheY-like chemotaxis protein
VVQGDVVERQHVLVIEDDASTRELYAALLAEEGYIATLSPTPELEPPAIATMAPDVILLDLRFQHDLDGLVFLEQIKADPQSRSIPVLVCSADHHRLEQYRDQLVAWDCGVLGKPFDLEDLLVGIRACIAPHCDGTPSVDRA